MDILKTTGNTKPRVSKRNSITVTLPYLRQSPNHFIGAYGEQEKLDKGISGKKLIYYLEDW